MEDKYTVHYRSKYGDQLMTQEAMNMTDAYVIFNRYCKDPVWTYVELRKNNITIATYDGEKNKEKRRK